MSKTKVIKLPQLLTGDALVHCLFPSIYIIPAKAQQIDKIAIAEPIEISSG